MSSNAKAPYTNARLAVLHYSVEEWRTSLWMPGKVRFETGGLRGTGLTYSSMCRSCLVRACPGWGCYDQDCLRMDCKNSEIFFCYGSDERGLYNIAQQTAAKTAAQDTGTMKSVRQDGRRSRILHYRSRNCKQESLISTPTLLLMI